jgi:transposase
MDMSRSYITGVSETMPQAEITFDRFHIASKMNEAVDKIRRNDDAIKSSRIITLNNRIKKARASKLEPVRDFVKMLYQHWYGIKAYFKKVASNAFTERVNLKIQEIIRTVKGYRNIQNFITMIYFHLCGLNLKTHY